MSKKLKTSEFREETTCGRNFNGSKTSLTESGILCNIFLKKSIEFLNARSLILSDWPPRFTGLMVQSVLCTFQHELASQDNSYLIFFHTHEKSFGINKGMILLAKRGCKQVHRDSYGWRKQRVPTQWRSWAWVACNVSEYWTREREDGCQSVLINKRLTRDTPAHAHRHTNAGIHTLFNVWRRREKFLVYIFFSNNGW